MSAPVAAIFDALLTRFGTLNVGAPALPLSMPDVTFTKPASGKYVEAKPFNNVPAWEGLEDDVLSQGLFVMGVVWPRGEGLAPFLIADAVAAHFPKDLVMTSGQANVKVHLRPLVGSAIEAPDKTTVPITISWRA